MKTVLKNVIYMLVGALIMLAPFYMMIKSQEDIIIAAIEKETSTIENTFKTHIEKLKNKNGEVDVTTSPVMENQMENVNEQARYYRERNWKLFNRKR